MRFDWLACWKDHPKDQACGTAPAPEVRDVLTCPFDGGVSSLATVKYSEKTAAENEWGQALFHYVSCQICGANNLGLVGYRTPEKAIEHWNLRSQAAADRETIGRLRERHEWIVALSAGWDANGSTGPIEPFSWETVGRMALDYSRGALLLTDPGGVPKAEALPALSLGRRVIDVRNGESTAATPEVAALPGEEKKS